VNFWRSITMAFFVVCWLVQTSDFSNAEQKSSGQAILILDASGSMWGQVNGTHKFEIARDAITQMLDTWDPEIGLGLLAYGHRKKGDCSDIELIVPVRQNNMKRVSSAVQKLGANGKTPIGAALIQAAERLGFRDSPATVILVTDGLETCGYDPCEVSRTLAANGVQFVA